MISIFLIFGDTRQPHLKKLFNKNKETKKEKEKKKKTKEVVIKKMSLETSVLYYSRLLELVSQL